jgi:hemerythrin-like metal-binding protein
VPVLLRLGHPLIDRQHRQLERLSRALARLSQRGMPCRSALTAYLRATRRHFATEERLMAAHRYADAAGHKALHDGVLTEMERLRTQLPRGATLHERQAAALGEWLEHHISEADRNLAAFLSA